MIAKVLLDFKLANWLKATYLHGRVNHVWVKTMGLISLLR